VSRTDTVDGAGTLRRALTTPKIVFLVVAAAAPAAAMVGTVPLAFAIGNGVAVPAAFAFAALTLLCFSVGYAAMSRWVVNTGGFYTYLARGLGRPPAAGGAFVAVLSYSAVTIGLVGAFSYFAQLTAAAHGLNLPWPVWAAVVIVVLAVLGYHEIELSARLLAVLMLAEVAVLVVLDLAILGHRGAAALPAASFSPHAFLSPGLGVAMMFAFMSFIGFESAALYGEEAREPRRSVPLATYISVIVIGVFYTLTSWAAVGGVGTDRLVETAQRDLGNVFFNLSGQYVGPVAAEVLQVLVCTSLFAAVLALHNGAGRYLFALGRERVLPASLGRVHPRHGTPHRASLVLSVVTTVVVGGFALAGLDPYVNLSTSMVGLGTLGIVVLQAAAALSVVGFFRRRPDRHWWRTLLAPLLGLAGLLTAVVLLVANFALITGTKATVVNLLPLTLVLAAAGGVGYAMWLRRNRPGRYAALAAETEVRPDAREPVATARR
jgi:amino acid transporter